MNRHPSARRLAEIAAGIVLGLGTGFAFAADGAALFEQKCLACHGDGGASRDSSIPTIGGYSAKYIVESVANFRKKLRPCAEVSIPAGPNKGSRSDMCKVVADLSDDPRQQRAAAVRGDR